MSNIGRSVSIDSPSRHWEFPYARLADVTPAIGEPFLVAGGLLDKRITGHVLTLDADQSMIIGDVTQGAVYRYQVRNVLTYAAAVEATWDALNVGTPVYYDGSSTMPAGVKLSTSPLDKDGLGQALFGYVVPDQGELPAAFPKGGAGASTQTVAVMMVPLKA
jgi:hypothetical protein